jgi:hypothetical protein
MVFWWGKKLEGRIPLGTLRHRREDNIKTDLRKIGWRLGLDLSGSGQELVPGSCEHDNEP